MTYYNTIFKTKTSGVFKISSLGRPPSLLACLSWGRFGLRGVGSSGVGVGKGSGVFTRGGVPVLVLVVRVYFLGLWDGLLSLSAYLGVGRCGIQGVGSLGVVVREGAGVLVLQSLRAALVFGSLPAWGILARGGVPVPILEVWLRCPDFWDVILLDWIWLLWLVTMHGCLGILFPGSADTP